MTSRALVLIGFLGGCAFDGSSGGTPAPDGPLEDGPGMDAMPDSPMIKCPMKYELVVGAPVTSRYLKLDKAETHAKQAGLCAADGAHLVVIDHVAEGLAIDVYATKRGGFFWIGVSDAAAESTWMTAKDQPAMYLPWKTNEPNGGIAENCVLQHASGWGDFRCDSSYPSVCECD